MQFSQSYLHYLVLNYPANSSQISNDAQTITDMYLYGLYVQLNPFSQLQHHDKASMTNCAFYHLYYSVPFVALMREVNICNYLY